MGFSENMVTLGSLVNRCDSALWLSGGDAARLTAPVVVPLGAYKWFCGPERSEAARSTAFLSFTLKFLQDTMSCGGENGNLQHLVA